MRPEGTDMYSIVTDYRTLNAMQRRGFIVARPGYDRHWTGRRIRNYFVDCGPALENWYDEFNYNGKAYRLRYLNGSFHPFVCESGKPLPAFV